MPAINFRLNGETIEAHYEAGMTFLDVLREECQIVSAKNGCAPEGTCGCCTVLLDGRPAMACLRRPEQMAGREVVSLEGIPEELRRVLSEAFVVEGGVQCGFCIPGIVVRAASLMQQGQADNREVVAKALDAHVCRCTGYARIIDAIQTAGEAWKDGKQVSSDQPRRHCFFGEEFGLSRSPESLPCADGNGNGKETNGDGIGKSPLR